MEDLNNQNEKRWWILMLIMILSIVSIMNWKRIDFYLDSVSQSARKIIEPSGKNKDREEWHFTHGWDDEKKTYVRSAYGKVSIDTLRLTYIASEKENIWGELIGTSHDGGKTYKGFYRWARGWGNVRLKKVGPYSYLGEGWEGGRKLGVFVTRKVAPPKTDDPSLEHWYWSIRGEGKREFDTLSAYGKLNAKTLSFKYYLGGKSRWGEVTGNSTDNGDSFDCFFRWEKTYGRFTLKRIGPKAYRGWNNTGESKEEMLLTWDPKVNLR
jgi:hypothetical protein